MFLEIKKYLKNISDLKLKESYFNNKVQSRSYECT